jgi:Spy/CpxP family protein refolding chaperone
VARRVQVRVFDDIDGSDGASTLEFGLEGVSYEIDLTDEHAAQLRELLTPYVSSARRVSAPARRQHGKRSGNGGPDPREVRAWAQSHGKTVSNRGRVPASLIAEFEEAHAR